jgi:chorismate mutase-like protein
VPLVADLDSLRARIDELDRALIDVVAERLEVCRQVAEVKGRHDTPVIQPGRVRDVLTTRRQQSIEAGIDPDFAEQIFRVLLAETHRIEVAGGRPDAAPDKQAATSESPSPLDTIATRVDHVVIAVHDVPAARASLVERFGFRDAPVVGGGGRRVDLVAVTAGGVTLVLVGPGASPAVARYLDRHGDGVQHVAIEVLNAGYAHDGLAAAGAPLITDVVVDEDGHEQFFAGADPATGRQLGFISRVGHRVGVGTENVVALFDALGD